MEIRIFLKYNLINNKIIDRMIKNFEKVELNKEKLKKNIKENILNNFEENY